MILLYGLSFSFGIIMQYQHYYRFGPFSLSFQQQKYAYDTVIISSYSHIWPSNFYRHSRYKKIGRSSCPSHVTNVSVWKITNGVKTWVRALLCELHIMHFTCISCYSLWGLIKKDYLSMVHGFFISIVSLMNELVTHVQSSASRRR